MHRIEGENVDISSGVNLFRATPPYTNISPEIMNSLQEEIVNVIEDAGIDLNDASGDTRDQLIQAIRYHASIEASKVTLPRNYISGLVGSSAADTDHDITIAVGICRDSTNTETIELLSPITKQIDAAWSEGSNVGGLFSGVVANNTEYYMFAIVKDSDGTVDAGFDTSITAANKPAGWTIRSNPIHWVSTNGIANINLFDASEIGGGTIIYHWKTPPLDVNLANALTTARRLDALSVPTGYEVIVNINIYVYDTTDGYAYIYYPDANDQAPSFTVSPLSTLTWISTIYGIQNADIKTNLSRQIAARSTIATTDLYRLATLGFKWRRF